ncbi:MAG: response regulator transcription factor [Bryobacterales bacterium]|nr:response regulator transcription factor [Bryobacterales bacterium]
MKKPRILLADDHKIMLEGLRGLLSDEFELVGTVSDGREMIEACRRLHPDVVVADVSMPLLNGIDAARILRDDGSRSRIVFLTMHPDLSYATRALEAGAAGYVLKHAASDELVAAIHEALAGRTYLSPGLQTPAMLELLASGKPQTRETLRLTARQIEVLQLLAEGRSAKEIGAILNISARTVEFHKYKMMDDLGVHSSAELVQYAIRHGLVSV